MTLVPIGTAVLPTVIGGVGAYKGLLVLPVEVSGAHIKAADVLDDGWPDKDDWQVWAAGWDVGVTASSGCQECWCSLPTGLSPVGWLLGTAA